MTLDGLGPRICILGPSASGKSTLADAIGRARGLPPVHLDQLAHLSGTDWEPRSEAAFAALHDRAVAGERWVVEGNYIWLLPRRLERATGLVLLDVGVAASLVRYLRRCWFEPDRVGALAGGLDTPKWDMVRHILGATRAIRRRNRALFDATALPKLRLAGPAALDACYRANGLTRRAGA